MIWRSYWKWRWKYNASQINAPYFFACISRKTSNMTIMCILLLSGISCIISGSHDGHIRCLSRDTGKEIWSIDLGSIIFSSPFPIASSNHVVVGTTAGELVVLKCTYETCFPICSTRLDGEIYSSPICVMELVSSKYCNGRRENTVTATHYDHDIYCRIFVGSRDNSVANFNVSSLPTLN
jgi:WD40 repeat protein